MTYTMSIIVTKAYDETVEAVRSALSDQGFGVLTEIDVAATLRAKLDVEIPPQIILGACRPQLAYEALNADPSIGVLLPCNVVVRSVGEDTCAVEALDPDTMTSLSDSEALAAVATDARTRLSAALTAIASDEER